MKTVLVTGGAGYLGSILTRKLLDSDYKVKVLDNFTFKNNSLSKIKNKKNLKIIKGDIRDLGILLDSVEGVDSVIHLAAIVGDPASALDPQRALEINFLATKMLVDCCRYHSLDKFIFASTCSVYGKTKNKTVNENSKLNPVSFYANHKIRSENFIIDNSNHKFNPTILRMGTLFGLSPRMRFDLVINLFAGLAFQKQIISIEGGQQWRPFVHVDDAARAYLLAIEKNNSKGIFNVGSNDLNEKIINVGKYVTKILPKTKIKISKISDERNYKVDFSKVEKKLKFETKKSIEKGLTEIITGFENNLFGNWQNVKYYNNKYLAKKRISNVNKAKEYYFA